MEAITFDPPKSKLTIQNSMLNDRAIHRLILEHHFNHKVEIFVPFDAKSLSVPQPIEEKEFFYHLRSDLSFLFDAKFIEEYIKKGDLYLISVGSWLDSGNVLSVQHGQLTLAVDRQTYLQLGLEGQKSTLRNNSERYWITLPLNSDHFTPGSKYYERIRWCLTERIGPCEVLLTWCDDEGHVTPVNMSHTTLTARRLHASQQLFEQLAVPHHVPLAKKGNEASEEKSNTEDTSTVTDEHLLQLHEWLGALSCRALDCCTTAHPEFDPFVAAYSHELTTTPAKGVTYTYSGLITPAFIMRLIDHFKAHIPFGWIALSVWGFEDAPVSWGNHEHGYHCTGDNDYCLIIDQSLAVTAFITTGMDAYS